MWLSPTGMRSRARSCASILWILQLASKRAATFEPNSGGRIGLRRRVVGVVLARKRGEAEEVDISTIESRITISY